MTIKEAFQKIVIKCERVFKSGCDQILEECGVNTASGARKRQKLA